MRELTDGEGRAWVAEVASHGRTSGYLNPKVHRPVVQFSCRSVSLPRRYASLPAGRGSLDALSDTEVVKLFGKAKTY